MALDLKSGILAQAAPAANTATTIYTAPANITASAAVNVCSRATVPTTVRVGVQKGSGTISQIVHDEPLTPTGMSGNNYEARAVVLGPGDKIIVWASAANVDFLVTGFEQPASFVALDA